jgi:aminoglycoside 6'-N-acetyltransferase
MSELETPTLQEGDLLLRPASLADVPALVAIRTKPEVFAHWRGGDDLHAAVLEDFAEDTRHCVLVLDGCVVGWIQWEVEAEPDYYSANIDLYLDPDVRGRGIGVQAIRAVARFLFEDEGHHLITIDPAAHNEAAIRCYTKVGFKPVGIIRQAERGNDGTWHDSLLMDLLAEDLTSP